MIENEKKKSKLSLKSQAKKFMAIVNEVFFGT